jgi:hypothetical protein
MQADPGLPLQEEHISSENSDAGPAVPTVNPHAATPRQQTSLSSQPDEYEQPPF